MTCAVSTLCQCHKKMCQKEKEYIDLALQETEARMRKIAEQILLSDQQNTEDWLLPVIIGATILFLDINHFDYKITCTFFGVFLGSMASKSQDHIRNECDQQRKELYRQEEKNRQFLYQQKKRYEDLQQIFAKICDV